MTPEEVMDLEAGARIHHRIFGSGTVLESIDQDGHVFGGPAITIRFDDHGVKQLVTHFTAGKLTREWP